MVCAGVSAEERVDGPAGDVLRDHVDCYVDVDEGDPEHEDGEGDGGGYAGEDGEGYGDDEEEGHYEPVDGIEYCHVVEEVSCMAGVGGIDRGDCLARED